MCYIFIVELNAFRRIYIDDKNKIFLGLLVNLVKVKVKQSLYRSITGSEGSRRLRLPDSRQMVQESGKVVSPTQRPPLTHQQIPVVLISVRG
jgi:hypothetical protein